MELHDFVNILGKVFELWDSSSITNINNLPFNSENLLYLVC